MSQTNYRDNLKPDQRKKADEMVRAMGYDPTPRADLAISEFNIASKECPRVLTGGEANPEYVNANIMDIGFTCPREEYIESPLNPSVADVAERWGISYDTLHLWSAKGNWFARRSEYWVKIKESEYEVDPKVTALARKKMLAEHETAFAEGRRGLRAAARRATKTILSPMGDKVEVPWDMKDWSMYAKALETFVKGEREATGIDRPADQQEGASPDKPKVVNFNFTINQDHRVGADVIESSDAIEGQIVEPPALTEGDGDVR
jgi:hypothetical protein